MPNYEYQCPKCGIVEVEQKITDESLKICPKCNQKEVEKLISFTSFQLKGNGWYQTDYKKKN